MRMREGGSKAGQREEGLEKGIEKERVREVLEGGREKAAGARGERKRPETESECVRERESAREGEGRRE